MQISTLQAISPIDGRYQHFTQPLSAYFAEEALIRYRLFVEVEYFIYLGEKKFFPIPASLKNKLRKTVLTFSLAMAEEIKATEAITNHDVKAVEYFLKNKLEQWGASHLKEWVHFGLTSQDINNTAVPLLWKDALEQYYLPLLLTLQQHLSQLAKAWRNIPMLARTHGQPASPTRLGKEINVFVERLQNQVQLLSHIPFMAKFGGATGNLNAHVVAFPKTDWVKFANNFVDKKLGLQRQQCTTQIEHYDMLAAHFDSIKRINTILIDLCRDLWTYISMDYFKQKTKKNEIGSSAMPHKVNPIDFENAEGNLGIANALFEHIAAKLPVSRLQRDLTDSTVIRNIGVPLAHTGIALNAIEKGLNKLILNPITIHNDLEKNWAVVAEAIQTILRRENYPAPYEALKTLTRGKAGIQKKDIHAFIDKLKISAVLKKELKAISPQTYTGI
ncbi:MAG: adenylosuccinate lyase [Niastella sp. SCN 39-18]|nr:adenylosuccinate lyase [Sphingobacteriales bacterium]ODT52181.1 MAG: adenylosuccinate lyase [Niastella sp. SCN 39-18]OJW11134.1 MAG: adenylosuccinate lyase [Sphingobacteriales bacterium 39-19]